MADPMPPPPDAVRELADACLAYVTRAVGVELDFTPETLPILDHYLRNVPPETSDEVLGLVGPTAGAYFGEVVRRSLGGNARWEHPADDYSAWRLVFDRVGLSFNPIGAALECARRGEVEGSGAHFQVRAVDRALVDDALARTEPVPADDFHRLAVRYDALEHVLEVLLARAQARHEMN